MKVSTDHTALLVTDRCLLHLFQSLPFGCFLPSPRPRTFDTDHESHLYMYVYRSSGPHCVAVQQGSRVGYCSV